MTEATTYQRLAREAMSAHDVARLLGITYSYVRKLTQQEHLPTARKVGRDVIYWPPDVEAIRAILATDRRSREYRESRGAGKSVSETP